MDSQIAKLLDKAVAGERLSPEDGLTLLECHDLAALGRAADHVTRRLHPEPYRTYNIDRNINYTNVCTAVCDFCAFYRSPKSPEGCVLDRQELLDKVQLSHRLKHKPRELSGGEMQRTAIARALVNRPKVLLADEPTGNLDRAAGQGIIDILRNLNTNENLTIVMVTHDENIARQADRTVRLVEGRID